MANKTEDARCEATTGQSFLIDGQSTFRCELPAQHVGPHHLDQELVEATWTETPSGGRSYTNTRIGRRRDLTPLA